MSHLKEASISVIIPVFNGKNIIADAVNSVRLQTLQPQEIIIIDDGSEDNTLEVINRMDGVTCYRQNNAGTAVARNEGIKKSNGKYLAFLDADDVWKPRKLELQYQCLNTNSELDAIFCHVQNRIMNEAAKEHYKEINNIIGYIPSAMFIKKRSFLSVGLFDTSTDVEAFDWFLRAKEYGLKKKVVDEILVERRISTTNKGILGNRKKYMKKYFKAIKDSLDRQR